MTSLHLLDPSGTLRAVLAPGASHEEIVSRAYGLAAGDLLGGALVGDNWELSVFLKKPVNGSHLRRLGVTIPATAKYTPTSDSNLYELAALDLWDRGWAIKLSHNEGPPRDPIDL